MILRPAWKARDFLDNLCQHELLKMNCATPSHLCHSLLQSQMTTVPCRVSRLFLCLRSRKVDSLTFPHFIDSLPGVAGPLLHSRSCPCAASSTLLSPVTHQNKDLQAQNTETNITVFHQVTRLCASLDPRWFDTVCSRPRHLHLSAGYPLREKKASWFSAMLFNYILYYLFIYLFIFTSVVYLMPLSESQVSPLELITNRKWWGRKSLWRNMRHYCNVFPDGTVARCMEFVFLVTVNDAYRRMVSG